MSVPFTIGRLIDYFTSPNPDLFLGLTPTMAAASLVGVFTLGACANFGRSLLMRLSGLRIIARLRKDTYASALRQEVNFIENSEGDVLSRLSVDTNIVGESVTGNLSDGLRAVVTGTVGVGLMFYLSPTLTALMLAIVPPISLGAVLYGRYLKRLSKRTQEALGKMSDTAQESISALRTVQASNAEKHALKLFAKDVDSVLGLQRKEAFATATFYGSTGLAGNVTILALLGYGGTLVSRGVISVGDLSSLLLYSAYVGGSMGQLSSFFTTLMKGVGAGTRIFDLLEREPVIAPSKGTVLEGRAVGTIKFEGVRFAYPKRRDVQVLDGFDLEIKPGESVALVGKSGSGKSSVQALLLRFYDPDLGQIKFNGTDIRDYTPASWRSQIGLVPQDPVLFSGTIAENIAYDRPDASQAEIEEAARLANCEFVWDFPEKFETKINKNSLSGGQRQRVAIARALLKHASILCLDEASAALDGASEHKVNDAIAKILQSRTVSCLIVAHRLSTIQRAEKVAVLDEGRIVEIGTYKELASREGSKFREVMGAQIAAVEY
ncbi:ATP-dependent permease MDL1, mitochondrial AltName: Full=ABC transporter mdl1; Flags: Precursor [Serendipita indica DSM 11827]|uniref:Probable ATP-binding cassette (ABC) transporter n=1 Tax=Serendipita indica (strain DSM 11827) TaxID=1109443 RepID=G4TB32_SERID|nr:ATP-dependent permease MDL1, mitochondrial AltName: Full=ABC transporter mdl1; Flags: Precursor [Serendipita indica DSM 11827]CCA68516.1 probable ATP-binding cassette (ABC) transporter [Serendipita indica DSM 11827]